MGMHKLNVLKLKIINLRGDCFPCNLMRRMSNFEIKEAMSVLNDQKITFSMNTNLIWLITITCLNYEPLD